MYKVLKVYWLIFYFSLSLFLMETLLRAAATGKFLTPGLFFTLIFSIPFAVILYILCGIINRRLRMILAAISIGMSSFVFSSQFIYYKFFKTFYCLYSAGNAGQIFEFWEDILALTLKNFLWVILFFLPVIIFIPLRKKLLSFEMLSKPSIITLCLCVFIINGIGLAAINIGRDRENSPYSLYYNESSPVQSIQKLGLITSMQLDLKRQMSDWTEEPVVSAIALPYYEYEAEIETAPPREVKTQYNTMDIDFANLISKESNKTINDMHKYFQGVSPTAKNEYTGKYKGYNLILITAEGFSPYAVRQDVTPTLYKMVHEGFNFTNFYNPIWGVSTSDGEYVACTSLIPKGGVWSFYKSGSIRMPFVMGNQLNKLGYRTLAYHNHTYTFYKRNISHPNMGYEYKGLGNGLTVNKTWPESDLEMMEKTIPEYVDSSPFHVYYMTVSGHLRYSFTGNAMSQKNRDYVEALPYSEAPRAYIACQVELDRALEYLLKRLDEEGIAEKTLIALSADHYPYGLEKEQIDELAGHTVEKNFEIYKSTFILYSKGMTPITIDKPCSSLDIIPTLSNLLGLQYDSRLLMGRDIFSNSDPLVIFSNRSFITDKGKYNSDTGEFLPTAGINVDKDYRKSISAIVNSKFYYSAKILENDYYNKVLKK